MIYGSSQEELQRELVVQRAAPHQGPLAPGSLLAGRYRIQHLLGHGGMGVVYLGEHVAVGRKVAIKLITPRWARDPMITRRFRAEPRLASAAGHPNIVEVFDAGELPDGSLYIVMEFLSGETLREYVSRRGRLSEAESCRLIADVARAVRAAHRVGVIHRDLKLDNITVTRNTALAC
ncbi:MAG: serine/threonine protein kinase [Myxococcales bacterium]|nr:serine/threonine protein kinase [Myxococcales bacterium]MCB9755958.1 serine/threonine protein kinase [Myxococcales bacterium]